MSNFHRNEIVVRASETQFKRMKMLFILLSALWLNQYIHVVNLAAYIMS